MRRLERLADEKFEATSDALLGLSAHVAVLQRVEQDRNRGYVRTRFDRTFKVDSDNSDFQMGIDFESYLIEYLVCTQVLPALVSMAAPPSATVKPVVQDMDEAGAFIFGGT